MIKSSVSDCVVQTAVILKEFDNMGIIELFLWALLIVCSPIVVLCGIITLVLCFLFVLVLIVFVTVFVGYSLRFIFRKVFRLFRRKNNNENEL